MGIILNPQSKLLWHGDRVRNWLEGGDPSPILIEIATTGFCNATCPWCFFKDKNAGGSIDKDIMLRTLRELAKIGVKAINWTGGGEPTLHPNFDEFVTEAYALGLEQGLFTNAYLEIKKSSMFKWIRISLTDKEFKPIKRPKGYFGICVNMLVDMPPEKLREWCEEARDINARYFQVRPALEGNYLKQPMMIIPSYLKEYETDDFKVILTLYKFKEAVIPHEYDKCYGYHFCPSINWKEKVGVCLYRMGEEKYIFGDLKEKSFTEIWHHKKISNNLVNEGCQNCCKNHEINKALFMAKQMEQINFL